MTLEECREAAKKALPVVHIGIMAGYSSRIPYARIKQVGFDIDEKGGERPFVQLLDMCKNSVCYVRPEEIVTVKEYEQERRGSDVQR